tara:strand:- start:5449 stop:6888 length:1440 start_codon:yes stop_codon:yes gene_type:complete
MAKLIDLTTLAKTSVASTDFLLVTNSATGQSKKLSVETMFPSVSTAGTSSETLYNSATLTNKNQLVFKGIKSGDTGLLTVATTSSNIVLTPLESGIDLSLCNNTTSGFLNSVDFTGTVTGENGVTNGGTGLSTIAKGALLYASDTDTIAATAVPTNGQVLIGNATTGVPAWATLAEGDNITIAEGAGSITITASLATLAADLDCSTYDINLNAGAGASWISGNGNKEGLTVDADGKVFIGEDTPTAVFAEALNVKGSIRFLNTDAPTIKPTDTSGGTTGQPLTIQGGGSAAANAGNLILKAGTSTSGNNNGGHVTLHGGSEAGSGDPGSIKMYTYTAGASETQALTVDSNQDVTVDNGSLVITGATEGIIHTNSGTVTQATDHTNGVTINASSGIITLAAVALANDTNVEFTVTNSYAKTTSVILVSMQDENTTNNAQLSCATHTHANGSFKISIMHSDATGATSATASKIHFLIINPS